MSVANRITAEWGSSLDLRAATIDLSRVQRTLSSMDPPPAPLITPAQYEAIQNEISGPEAFPDVGALRASELTVPPLAARGLLTDPEALEAAEAAEATAAESNMTVEPHTYDVTTRHVGWFAGAPVYADPDYVALASRPADPESIA